MITGKKYLSVFVILVVVSFSITGFLQICKADGPQIIFSDNFNDGDISDWDVTTIGTGAVFEVSYVNFSLHMNSPEGSPDKQAMGVSPSFDPTLDLSEDYNVYFSFLIPHTANHWFEVFNNHQTYLVIDSDSNLKCYLGNFQSQMIKTLNTDQWYDIEIRVHQSSSDYDVYIDGQLEQTCSFWIHSGFENSFRIGDRENGTNDYGQAYWDDFVITQPADSDGDMIADPNDNCPDVANPGQEDRNSDGLGDACECDAAANIDNDSGQVDLGDFALVSFDWSRSGVELPGDVNKSGVVDLTDLEIVAYHWLSTCD